MENRVQGVPGGFLRVGWDPNQTGLTGSVLGLPHEGGLRQFLESETEGEVMDVLLSCRVFSSRQEFEDDFMDMNDDRSFSSKRAEVESRCDSIA